MKGKERGAQHSYEKGSLLQHSGWALTFTTLKHKYVFRVQVNPNFNLED
jgi:hypothetical protein